ncbi:hypothetical protein ACHAWF_013539, partial [Thalassiosira exigua]
QYSSAPVAIRYKGVRLALKYLYCTRDDGIYFWRTTPNDSLPDVPPPKINSNAHDLLLDGRPKHDALDPHGYMDSDWGGCLRTRRSFGGTCIRLAGGPIAYRSRLQKTVAGSSTEAEFMEASDTGKLMLYVRSVMYNLGIPQGAASQLYEDNDACIAIGNAQKPTTRTRHVDIRYFALCEWIERDLLVLERVDTTRNMLDHFTKQLNPILFARHTDYVMGRSVLGFLPVAVALRSPDDDVIPMAGGKRGRPRRTPPGGQHTSTPGRGPIDGRGPGTGRGRGGRGGRGPTPPPSPRPPTDASATAAHTASPPQTPPPRPETRSQRKKTTKNKGRKQGRLVTGEGGPKHRQRTPRPPPPPPPSETAASQGNGTLPGSATHGGDDVAGARESCGGDIPQPPSHRRETPVPEGETGETRPFDEGAGLGFTPNISPPPHHPEYRFAPAGAGPSVFGNLPTTFTAAGRRLDSELAATMSWAAGDPSASTLDSELAATTTERVTDGNSMTQQLSRILSHLDSIDEQMTSFTTPMTAVEREKVDSPRIQELATAGAEEVFKRHSSTALEKQADDAVDLIRERKSETIEAIETAATLAASTAVAKIEESRRQTLHTLKDEWRTLDVSTELSRARDSLAKDVDTKLKSTSSFARDAVDKVQRDCNKHVASVTNTVELELGTMKAQVLSDLRCERDDAIAKVVSALANERDSAIRWIEEAKLKRVRDRRVSVKDGQHGNGPPPGVYEFVDQGIGNGTGDGPAQAADTSGDGSPEGVNASHPEEDSAEAHHGPDPSAAATGGDADADGRPSGASTATTSTTAPAEAAPNQSRGASDGRSPRWSEDDDETRARELAELNERAAAKARQTEARQRAEEKERAEANARPVDDRHVHWDLVDRRRELLDKGVSEVTVDEIISALARDRSRRTSPANPYTDPRRSTYTAEDDHRDRDYREEHRREQAQEYNANVSYANEEARSYARAWDARPRAHQGPMDRYVVPTSSNPPVQNPDGEFDLTDADWNRIQEIEARSSTHPMSFRGGGPSPPSQPGHFDFGIHDAHGLHWRSDAPIHMSYGPRVTCHELSGKLQSVPYDAQLWLKGGAGRLRPRLGRPVPGRPAPNPAPPVSCIAREDAVLPTPQEACSPIIPEIPRTSNISTTYDGDVFNYVSLAMRLTRGKLLKQPDWSDWQSSEYTQLDQYDAQGMFGDPTHVDSDGAVFNLVWTYVIKELDKRKKARCTCDGSTRSGQVRVLDYTYANCVDQTSARLFYAVAAAENLVVFGADVSNAFGEAPPPKQGFYIRPDKAFRHWWTHHKGRDPIPPGHVIPILAAMQGHPEAPRLWERHADTILRSLGLTPTVHEPCLYSGIIDGERVVFLR